ncbi:MULTISPECIES: MBL fold metallo-hydrolase [Chelativorans]|uniref:MBL fold metallo-hydrolase n=1 Tax=Chelativorans TaxID=449972 RepID=UPI00005418CC|nr:MULTISPECIES: MBL fold metallo-hydrolase [Chelativorans]
MLKKRLGISRNGLRIGTHRHSILARSSLLVATVLTLAGPTPAAAQPFEGCPSNPIFAVFKDVGRTGRMPPAMGSWIGDPDAQKIVPWKVFDNVHYVGVCWVSAWAIRTEDGVVLIDTLHEPNVDQLIANLNEVGIGLDEIKYVLMTHGHYDHVGGAFKLKPLLPNARFAMTRAGWDEALESAKQSEGTPRAWQMIQPDMVVKDGDVIKLGGNGFGILETPGHTWGTASYTYDVKDGGNTYRAITVGGLALTSVNGSQQVESYIASVDRIKRLVQQPGNPIAVHLTTHSFSAGLMEAREKLAARQPNQTHPLVDQQDLLAQLDLLRGGALRRLEVERRAGR